MSYPARQIPETGYQRSGWVRLDEMGRMLLLEEVIAAYGGRFYVAGTVNYEDSREPLLTEQGTGMFMTISEEIVQDEGQPLVIGINGGGSAGALAGNSPFLLMVAAGLLLWGVMRK